MQMTDSIQTPRAHVPTWLYPPVERAAEQVPHARGWLAVVVVPRRKHDEGRDPGLQWAVDR